MELVGHMRVALFVALLPITGCYHYRPQPIQPPALEQQYRSRSLKDAGLKEFIEAHPAERPSVWPPSALGLDGLTLVAFYFHPDLDTARARLATAQAAVITASTRPNPAISGGGGYTDSAAAPFVLRFGLDYKLVSAGRPQRFEPATSSLGKRPVSNW